MSVLLFNYSIGLYIETRGIVHSIVVEIILNFIFQILWTFLKNKYLIFKLVQAGTDCSVNTL